MTSIRASNFQTQTGLFCCCLFLPQVLRGGDRKVAFAFRDNYGGVLNSETDKQEHFFEQTIEDEGTHSGLKKQKCDFKSITPCDLCQYSRFLIQIDISFQFFIFSQSIGRYIHICIIFILKKHIGRTS